MATGFVHPSRKIGMPYTVPRIRVPAGPAPALVPALVLALLLALLLALSGCAAVPPSPFQAL